MKKILSIFLLLFAFSLSANAQTNESKKEVEIRAKAKKDLHSLTQVVDLSNNDALFKGLYQLFVDKHTNLSEEGITATQRQEESKRVSDKLIGSLKEDDITKLRQQGLFDKLIN
ncbi:hypothetical protein NAT51_17620 [Flavobacterium amniphilum]|uniref:hypothetical protein n=1 Tax=Flavobacterium amniphilum TaxID=1834035 RepID=UPI00202A6AF3|nr:hypothetical protein [Flavobacterium amniphilum]MCL9807351.1 hypothetical protein [Flavobacterium amniphilum]